MEVSCLALFEALSRHMSGRAEENRQSTHNSQQLNQDLKWTNSQGFI